MPERQVSPRRILRVNAEGQSPLDDHVVVERALEIRIGGQSLAVTLRTPGRDRELTLGFLASEGVIAGRSSSIAHSHREARDASEVGR